MTRPLHEIPVEPLAPMGETLSPDQPLVFRWRWDTPELTPLHQDPSFSHWKGLSFRAVFIREGQVDSLGLSCHWSEQDLLPCVSYDPKTQEFSCDLREYLLQSKFLDPGRVSYSIEVMGAEPPGWATPAPGEPSNRVGLSRGQGWFNLEPSLPEQPNERKEQNPPSPG